MMDGLISLDSKYAKTCLLAVSSLTATEDQKIIDKLCLEGYFPKIKSILFSVDVHVMKVALWGLSNMVCKEQ
jgi:hypothetical protein